MIEEFLNRVNEIYITFLSMNVAYGRYENEMKSILTDNSKNFSFGEGNPNDPSNKTFITENIGKYKERIKINGLDRKLMSNLCLVAIYQLWEDEYRKKIAEEKGIETNKLLIDILGDIRLIRIAIIHNNSKLISDFKRIKVLEFIKDREDIYLTITEFVFIVETLKDELHKIK